MTSACIPSGLLALLLIGRLLAQDPVPYVVRSATEHEVEVVQPAEVPGIPPVQATVTVTVQLVKDPMLPDPPPALPPASGQPPVEGEDRAILACLSATWYPQEQVSKVQWQHGPQSFQCLSRRNFLHLSGGAGNFQVGGRTYQLLLGIGTEDTTLLAESARRNGSEYQPPVFPAIPAGQDYVVTDGDPADLEGLQVIVDLHEKFRTEGAELERQWLARERALAERKAYLLAHPPVPPDVTMRFWLREHPVGMGAETIKPQGSN